MTNFIDPEKVSLANLAGGAAIERFNIELDKALANICDPNTDPKKARKIKLTVTLKPSSDRDHASTEISCESSLAPLESFSVPLYIGRGVDGKFVAHQSHFKQKTFADYQKEIEQPQTTENVKPFERKSAQ